MNHVYIIILAILYAFTTTAQNFSAPERYSLQLLKNTSQWGVTANGWINGGNYQNENSTIFSESPKLGIGAFMVRKNMRAQFSFDLIESFDFKFQYYIWQGLNATIGASVTDHNLEWQLNGYNNASDRENYRNLGSACFYESNISLGYAVVFSRFYVNIYAQSSYIFSDKETFGTIVNNSESNLRYKWNNTTELEGTFVYGGGIEIEMLPYFPKFPTTQEKYKNMPSKLAISPFIRIDLLGNSTSDMNYSVTVEEWVDGNIVYDEKSNDYDIFPYSVTFGLRWILGR